ncbi:MAG: thiamine pyrophosphate-binding protein [Propionibacteriaceae bacterium]|nr:thiamine pyrophosphate-binding protein [Propionibacteriaceae bacterium]
MATIRDVAFDVLRQFGLTRMFANPGSTEVALLSDLPEDLDFILGLHEASVVGMATGHALASDRPALVLLHTTAGLGNAVGAIATARVSRAPMVILVGQQDRRHLQSAPFLAGEQLELLAGTMPVAVRTPASPVEVPTAIAQAYHEATIHRGPVLVIIPMGDWDTEAPENLTAAAPARLRIAQGADPAVTEELADLLTGAERPAIVAGAGADTHEGFAALTTLAERLNAPVWQAAFSSESAFPHDHVAFRGHLPAVRAAIRSTLADHDLVLVVGAPAFKVNLHDPGPFVEAGTRIALLTELPDEITHSTADVAYLAPVAATCAAIADRLPVSATTLEPRPAPEVRPAKGPDAMTPDMVYRAFAERLPAESTFFEETPSSRGRLVDILPARTPLSYCTVTMGGLGHAVPASVGVKLAQPDRPVVAFVGDGASLYSIQGLWSAAHYGVGVLYVILRNGGYAVMDLLARNHGGKGPWPGFAEISVSTLAEGFGVENRRIDTHSDLLVTLDEIVPTLAGRTTPLLLDVAVES